MSAKKKERIYTVRVVVKSATGEKPIVKALGGDTVFVYLTEGMTAKFSTQEMGEVSDTDTGNPWNQGDPRED
jgi:hypothetical protein